MGLKIETTRLMQSEPIIRFIVQPTMNIACISPIKKQTSRRKHYVGSTDPTLPNQLLMTLVIQGLHKRNFRLVIILAEEGITKNMWLSFHFLL